MMINDPTTPAASLIEMRRLGFLESSLDLSVFLVGFIGSDIRLEEFSNRLVFGVICSVTFAFWEL